MNTENRFNLIDEPWIPIVDVGRVSLKQVFSEPSYKALGGNPVQKIALTKLLLAIAQAAYTPIDDEDWKNLGAFGMAQKCLEYLAKWHDRFWLYGEKPFLQMPEIAAAKEVSLGKLTPIIATGNTTVLNQSQIEAEFNDAEKALLLVQLMGFALGGKQVDNSQPLTSGYMGNKNPKGKPASGRPGRSSGYLHSFFVGNILWETLHANLLTKEDIEQLKYFKVGVGIPPWEKMPNGEACQAAQDIKNSYIGCCLVPLCRFIYFSGDSAHNADGILYDRGSKQAPKRNPDLSLTFDPMLTVNRSKKDVNLVWVNPEKRPWRELTSLLSCLSDTSSFKDCLQLRLCIKRVRNKYSRFGIWTGGMNFSDKAGEQSPRDKDDFVESIVMLESEWLGDIWYGELKNEMGELDKLASVIDKGTYKYHCSGIKKNKEGKEKNKWAKDRALNAISLFWQLCERKFQDLIDICGIYEKPSRDAELHKMHQYFASYANKAYDAFCPKETNLQLNKWAEDSQILSLKLSKYTRKEKL